ncbi:MAG: hypothetical protein KF757_13285 [Phycisphaeraceae bacterium]|nr:hypothetical protein [Phycisphaeraceae bacterium]MCW5763936.1 hypothetical protein [Phycisphaeraceae bacterium]
MSQHTHSPDFDAADWHALRKRKRRTGCLLLMCSPLLLVVALLIWMLPQVFAKPGTPRDYVAQFNERYANVPESDRAWPLIKQAVLIKYTLHGRKADTAELPQYPTWPAWEDSIAYIDSIQPALDLVREASTRPMLGRLLSAEPDHEFFAAQAEAVGDRYTPAPAPVPPMVGPPLLLSVVLDELGLIRRLSKELVADAHIAASRGQGDRVVEDLAALLNMGRLAAESETIIGQLVQVAIESLALNSLSQIITHHPDLFAELHLATLDSALRTIGRGEPATDNGLTRFVPNLEYERLFFDDILQRTYSDDGNGNGRLTLSGARFIASGFVTTSPDASSPVHVATMMLLAPNRQTLATQHKTIFDTQETQGRLRPWERDGAALNALYDSISPIGRSQFSLLSQLVPAFTSAYRTFDRIDTARDAMLTVVAIERYRLAHGAYPQSLDVLVPSLLPGLPFDPVDGQTLRYRLTESGFVLYSLGRDGVDDLGRPSTNRFAAIPHMYLQDGEDHSGDWVLHPTPYPEQKIESKTLFPVDENEDVESIDDSSQHP